MAHTPCVYVPNDTNIEYTNLHKWGAVFPIFKTHIYPDTTDEVRNYAATARVALREFRNDVDMLGLIGDPALGALAIMTLCSFGIRQIHVLKYDKHMGAYYPISLEVTWP